MADTILLKGASAVPLPTLQPREPAVAFDPMTGDATLFIGTPAGNRPLSGGAPGVGVGTAAADYGVRGDQATNNALALAAAVAPALAPALAAAGKTQKIVLPPGITGTETPWLLSSSDQSSGPIIQGAGPMGVPFGVAGSAIEMRAPGQDSVIKVGAGSMQGGRIQDLTILGYRNNVSPPDTGAGVLLAESNWTGWRIEDVKVVGTRYGVRVLYGSGNADGENLAISHSTLYGCGVCYSNEAPQAYGDSLTDCQLLPNAGGTALQIGLAGYGGFHFSADVAQCSFAAPGLTNTYLRLLGPIDSAQVQNSRCEKAGRVVWLDGGSGASTGPVTFRHCAFPGIPDGGAVVYGGGGGTQRRVTFEDCTFGPASYPAGTPGAATGGCTLNLFAGGDPAGSRRTFRRCAFQGWWAINTGAKPSGSSYGGTILDDCWRDTATDGAGGYLLTPLTN